MLKRQEENKNNYKLQTFFYCMESWVEKYRPKTVTEVAGREQEGLKVKEFVEKFPNVKKRALILLGPEKKKKTSIVYALAKDVNAEIFELNA